MSKIKGCWQLVDSLGKPVNLYTRRCCEFVSKGSKEYRRGEYKIFAEDKFPPLVEDDKSFSIYYPDRDHPGQFTLEDYAREVMVQGLIHK